MLEIEHQVFEVSILYRSFLPQVTCNMKPLNVDIQIACSPTVQEPTDVLNMFEVSPANGVIVPALVDLITYYKWTKMTLFVETKQEYSHEVLVFANWLQ